MFPKASWNYKGYICEVLIDQDEDCRKAIHEVISPNGEKLCPHITPYDFSREVVELWIDAGCPYGRNVYNGCDFGNWNKESLNERVQDLG